MNNFYDRCASDFKHLSSKVKVIHGGLILPHLSENVASFINIIRHIVHITIIMSR